MQWSVVQQKDAREAKGEATEQLYGQHCDMVQMHGQQRKAKKRDLR